MIQLDDIQQAVGKWSRYNFGSQPSWRPLLGIGEEAGELYHAFLKREQRIRGSDAEHKACIEDAIGDLVIYLCNFCCLEDINLEQVITRTWAQVSKRDWIKYPKNGVNE